MIRLLLHHYHHMQSFILFSFKFYLKREHMSLFFLPACTVAPSPAWGRCCVGKPERRDYFGSPVLLPLPSTSSSPCSLPVVGGRKKMAPLRWSRSQPLRPAFFFFLVPPESDMLPPEMARTRPPAAWQTAGISYFWEADLKTVDIRAAFVFPHPVIFSSLNICTSSRPSRHCCFLLRGPELLLVWVASLRSPT